MLPAQAVNAGWRAGSERAAGLPVAFPVVDVALTGVGPDPGQAPASARVAVVTGAGGGIGRATASLLASRGALLVVTDVKEGRLKETAGLVEQESPSGLAPVTVVADISTKEGTDLVVDSALASVGRIDILASIAGVCSFRDLDELTEADYRRTMDVNLYPTIRLGDRILPMMRSQGYGRIVVVTSDLAKQPERISPDYAISKAALSVWMKCAALTAGRDGVLVNAVAPGPILTNVWTDPGGLIEHLMRIHDTDDADVAVSSELGHRQLPLGRMGTPEEVAREILHLASDEATFTTGSTSDVGGGSIRGLY